MINVRSHDRRATTRHIFGCACHAGGAKASLSRRHFLAGAGALGTMAALPRIARAQGTAARVIDTHHHFYPPAYQKAWLDWEDTRKIPHFANQVAWSRAKATED